MCKTRRLWDGVVCVDSEETVQWYPVRERDALHDIRCPLWRVVQGDRVYVPWLTVTSNSSRAGHAHPRTSTLLVT